MRGIGVWAMAVALFFIAGGHWGALQTAAWAGMLWNYSQQEGSLLTGAKKTFDGEHPCSLCDSIGKAKGREKSAPAVVVTAKKIEPFPTPLSLALPPRECHGISYFVPSELMAAARPHAPPAPIPIPGIAA